MSATSTVEATRPSTIPPPPTEPPQPAVSTRSLVLRALLIGAYVGALGSSLIVNGVPTEREQVLAWSMAGLVAVSSGGRSSRAMAVIRDWLPFALVLFVYDYSRGLADNLGIAVRWTPQIDIDQWLGYGHVPTVWLQQHLLDRHRVHPWEIVPSVIYVSHFIVPFAVAAVLWAKDRDRWAAYARRFVALSFLGVATFVLVPAAPPWLASRAGYLPPLSRTVGRGWSLVGLDIANHLLHRGQESVNLVAAIPSLHAGYAALVAVFLWPTARWWVRLIASIYALLMAFTLVLSAEHYVVDVLIAWAFVALVMFVMNRAERWWRTRPDRQPAVSRPVVAVPSESGRQVARR